jgi:4-amino-4-deoxy-L-arabinose transferase-like glycosyltransferase
MSHPSLRATNAVSTTSMEESRGSDTVNGNGIAPPLSLVHRRSHLLLLVFAVALFVRVVALGVVQPWPLTPTSELWKSGLEIVNIASSITSHRGFSSPFALPSGPTAWIPPVYPYFIAAVFFIFGPRSNLAALCILAVQAIFSALICFPIYFVGEKAFDERTARWASWSWALFPYEVLIPVLFIWETALSALLLVVLCHLCMDLPTARRQRLVCIGTLWGVAALTNTALLSVMPFFLGWHYFRRSRTRTSLKQFLVVAFVFALVVAPWFLRNGYTFGALVPVRSNFGEELWLGNHEGGGGRTAFGISPSDNPVERERYRQLGEIAYISQRRAEALKFIALHPRSFIRGVLYRLRYWWFAEGEHAPVYYLYRLITLGATAGIVFVWRTGSRRADLPIIALMVFPLVYYLTDVYARYRYPIEPFMILLGVFAASQSVTAIRARLR